MWTHTLIAQDPVGLMSVWWHLWESMMSWRLVSHSAAGPQVGLRGTKVGCAGIWETFKASYVCMFSLTYLSLYVQYLRFGTPLEMRRYISRWHFPLTNLNAALILSFFCNCFATSDWQPIRPLFYACPCVMHVCPLFFLLKWTHSSRFQRERERT